MERYRDWDLDSGVQAFEFCEGQIDVQFKSGSIYRYTTSSVGLANLERMVALARAGKGLNSFINNNNVVKKGYSARLK